MIEDIEDIAKSLVEDDTYTSRDRGTDFKLKKRMRKEKATQKKIVNDEGSDCEVEFLPQAELPGKQRIYVKTYGCSHNISDSEFMMGQLQDYGYTISNSLDNSDIVLVNSCTVKNPSQQSFLIMVEKAKSLGKPVVVAGCVPQGETALLEKELKNVSVVGVQQIDRVVEVVEETIKGNTVQLLKKNNLPTLDLPKIRRNKYIEIIPINAGCLGACTYCKTKHARGKLLSYSIETLISRVKQVIKEGVRQIWLTSEDTGAYGRDIGTNISQLLKCIVEALPDGVMLRLGMTNPPYILEHLDNIALVLKHPRVFSFLHIPVQSGSNGVLTAMNREYTREEFELVCDSLLSKVPGMTIATDIICGFPGETEQQFDETMSLVEKYQFRTLNISQFYSRPGTAAEKMQKCNTKDVKARSQKLTRLFESFKRWEHLQGTIQRVWIHEKETKHGTDILIGHTKDYAKVVLPYNEVLLGREIILRVEKILNWHIEGTVIDSNPDPETVAMNFWGMFSNLQSSSTEDKVRDILLQQQREDMEEEKIIEQSKVEQCCDSQNQGGCQNSSNCCSNKIQDSCCQETNKNKEFQSQVLQQKQQCNDNTKNCNGNCSCVDKNKLNLLKDNNDNQRPVFTKTSVSEKKFNLKYILDKEFYTYCLISILIGVILNQLL